MAEAQWLLLPGKACLSGHRLQTLQLRQLVVLAALRQRVVQFELDVEMVFDNRLVAARHEDEVFDAGLPRLVDDVLDDRSVDDRQHFLRDRLGGWEKTRAETGDWKNCFADFFHAVNFPFLTNLPTVSWQDILTLSGHFHAGIDDYWKRDTSALPVDSTASSSHMTDMVN
jgi:hypothetical protein